MKRFAWVLLALLPSLSFAARWDGCQTKVEKYAVDSATVREEIAYFAVSKTRLLDRKATAVAGVDRLVFAVDLVREVVGDLGGDNLYGQYWGTYRIEAEGNLNSCRITRIRLKR